MYRLAFLFFPDNNETQWGTACAHTVAPQCPRKCPLFTASLRRVPSIHHLLPSPADTRFAVSSGKISTPSRVPRGFLLPLRFQAGGAEFSPSYWPISFFFFFLLAAKVSNLWGVSNKLDKEDFFLRGNSSLARSREWRWKICIERRISWKRVFFFFLEFLLDTKLLDNFYYRWCCTLFTFQVSRAFLRI